MPEGEVLEFAGVTKQFGAVTAVSDFSARAEPGTVTGFLGPNGAGKTTTLRILLGLVRASGGRATIGGKEYRDLANPLTTVGSVLEASSFHPGRTAAGHLRVYAQAASLPRARVDEALAQVGLSEVAGRKVGGFSLGMRQRLGLAFALLGDPGVLVLDEPANGLDPEGIIWMRSLLRTLAEQGRTILFSSHLLSEVQQTADQLVIISRGRLVFQGASGELSDPSERSVVVDAPDRLALAGALTAAGYSFQVLRGGLTVRGADAAEVGRVAFDAGVAVSSLQRRGASLEDVFLELVNGTRVHPSATGGVTLAAPAAIAAAAGAADAEATETTQQAETTGQVDVSEQTEASELAEQVDLPEDIDAEAVATATASEVDGTADVDDDAYADEADNLDDAAIDPDVAEAVEPAVAEAAENDPAGNQSDDAAPSDSTTAGFAVASTGVIEVVPADRAADDSSEATIGDKPSDDAAPHAWAVGATGVIDIVEQPADAADAPSDEKPPDSDGEPDGHSSQATTEGDER